MNKKYKIAVMGATGVGKTIFFGSYFNLVTHLGKGNRPIVVKSQSSVNRITELITQLFQKHEVVQGTSERVDFSFSVDSLGMDVELFDVPGGFTQDMDAWVEQKILPDLLRADGVLFFLSGEDIVNHPERVLKDNMVFASAISRIREHKSGDLKGRADVPIWFIFTKGDTIPEVPLETLKEDSLSLLNAAKKSQEQGSWLAKNIYAKGKHVNAYKSQAIGKWESPQKIPREYQPDNVIEPMEELFEAMTLSRSRYGKRKTGILTVVGLLLFSLFFGALYKIDQKRWTRMQERAKNFLMVEHYEQALHEVNAFSSLPLLPGPLKADKNLETFRKDFYRDCEAAAYAPIQAVLNGVDEETPPNVTSSFLEDAEKIRRYLAVSLFAEVHPQHYEQARRRIWYFEMGRLLSLDSQKEGNSPDELFDAILACLNCEAPESWLSRIHSEVDRRLRLWGGALSQDVEPEAFEAYINKAEQVVSHSRLSAESAEYLRERKRFWTREKANAWVRQAISLPSEESIALLERHEKEFDSPEREILKDALDERYGALADQVLNESPDDVASLQKLLQRYPSMTVGARDKLQSRIDSIREGFRKKQIDELKAIQNLEELAGRVKEITERNTDAMLMRAMEGILKKRVRDETENIRNSTVKAERDKGFAQTQHDARRRFESLRQTILPLGRDDSLTQTVEEEEKKFMERLEKAHLDSCKEEFKKRRPTRDMRDVSKCRDILEEFLELWPDSPEEESVRKVRNFLSFIQGGIRGTLIVVDGNFSSAETFDDTPDIFVTVSDGKNEIIRTKTVKDNVYPIFYEGKEILWRVDMPQLTFKAIDYDPFSRNDEVASFQIDPSGFDGYRKLTQNLESQVELKIAFKQENAAPECPWLEGDAR